MKKMHRILAGTMCTAMLLSSLPMTAFVAHAEAVELVNDTFEESFGTWKARTSGSTEIMLSDAAANSGAKSLYITGRTQNWNGAGASMIGTMYAGQTYDLSCYVMYEDTEVGGQNQQFNFQLMYTDANGEERYSYMGGANAQAGAWTQIKATYTVPSDATNIVIYVEGGTLSDFYLDDVVIMGEKMEVTDKEDGFFDNFDDGTAMSWQVRGSNTTLDVTNNAAHSGEYSIYCDGREQLWNGATCNKTLCLEAGGYYSFGCYVMYDGADWTDTQGFSINLQYDLDGKENYYTIATETAAKGQWQYVGTECTIPEGASNIYVYVQTAYKPDASVTAQDLMGFYVDDVSAERLPDPAIQEDIASLKDVYADDFKMGCAVAGSEFQQGATQDLILKHYNSVTIGNELKPESVLDQAATVAYMNANGGDQTNPQVSLKQTAAMLAFCEENDLPLRGHVLVWHSQTPDWFFKENFDANGAWVTPEIMDQRLENYIKNVMDAIATQYPDLNVYAWDVVNEAASDSGTIRPAGSNHESSGSSAWVQVYGDQSYIKKAFTFARQYAPAGCKLFYNDYNEYAENKMNYICTDILQELVDAKLIDGMGMQSHIKMSNPSIAQYENAIRTYADMGLEIQITELDIDQKSNSDEDMLALAERYRQVFEMYKKVKHDGVNLSAVVLWGITDSTSWIGGYPLLFDKNYAAKDAFYAVVDTDAEVQTINTARAYAYDGTAKGLEFAMEVQAAQQVGEAGSFKLAWNQKTNELVVRLTTDQDDLDVSSNDAELKETDGSDFILSLNETAAVGSSIRMDVVMGGTAWNSLSYDPTDSSSFGKVIFAEIPAYAEATQGTPTIDGTIDAIWADANVLDINTYSMGAGATGTAKVLWDKDYIYVLTEVKDPVLSKASPNVYEQDTVEIFLDENNHKTTAYESDDIQARVNYDGEKSITDGMSTDAFTSAAAKTADGYLVEFAIPTTLGGFKAGQVVGFDAQINDDGDGAGKRTSISNWYDLTGMGYTDMSGLGLLKLVGEGGETPAAVMGDVNLDGSVTIVDVVMLNKNVMGVQALDAQQMANADCDHDGDCTAADSLLILKSLVDLVVLK
ncbi:MAG: endo-1,4-beta-xylanase [Oscillospiraceae bacterium]|nr:endo-1,4-beta-xylanase [Oscillospiraceae bacterium]